VRDFLGFGILRKTRENLQNLGTLGVPLGLEIQGKPRENLENTSWPGNSRKKLGKQADFGKSRNLRTISRLGNPGTTPGKIGERP